MPSPQTTPKTSIRKQDKVQFGQKLAKRRSQEFSAKVAQWDCSGGGVAASDQKDDEIVVVVEEQSVKSDASEDPQVVVTKIESSAEFGTPTTPAKIGTNLTKQNGATSPPSARKATREVDITRKAWVRRKSKTQADKPNETVVVTPDVKHAGTPKKRVVSDGHWRRDRLVKVEPPKEEVSDDDVPVPVTKPLVIRQTIASVGTKIGPSAVNIAEERELRARRRAARRARTPAVSQDSSATRSETPSSELGGAKIFADWEPVSRPVSRDLKGHDNRGGKIQSAAPENVTLTPPSAAVERYLRLLVPAHDQLSPKEAAPAPESTVGRTRIKRRSPRTSDHKSDDPAVAIPEAEDYMPPQPPTVYANRIQGWLATTIDSSKQPAELRGKPKTALADNTTTSSGDTQASDSELASQTPTLRRRGARRTATSPIKERGAFDKFDGARDGDVPKALVVRPISMQLKPTTGKELSPIASVNSLTTLEQHRFIAEGSVLSHASDGDERYPSGGSKHRLTKHEDLISVLSVQRGHSKHRSRRGARPTQASTGNIMNDLTTDELKYQRELRTLVDGVIPVLLQYVLSSNEAMKSSGLLGRASQDTQPVTKPIVDMGVALERLKNVHKRIPMHDTNELIAWAESARSIYADYAAVWRLGFQDVVVNLAPADGAVKFKTQQWGSDLPRNEKGELTSAAGERVDVAYLLKRPLVRLKHLAKTFEAIHEAHGLSSAQKAATQFNDLVQVARLRAGEEKARLEDEAAAAIDPSRARECRTLAPIADVQIDGTRCVRARDFFDIDFRHTSGQCINCRVELIMRDDEPGRGDAGDVLFCEISTAGRWLLFPPVHMSMISARRGRKSGQMVIMLRGFRNDGSEWREVMALEAEEEESIDEWLGMLPSSPVPRNLVSKSSFDLKANPMMSGALPPPSVCSVERMPSVKEIEVPLGERLKEPTQHWNASEVNSDAGSYAKDLRRKQVARHRSQPAEAIPEEPRQGERPRSQDVLRSSVRPKSEYLPAAPRKQRPRPQSSSVLSRDDYSVWLPSSRVTSQEHSDEEDVKPLQKRLSTHRRTSSVPSLNLPTVNKLRINRSSEPVRTPEKSLPQRPLPEAPSTVPAKIQKRRSTPPEPVTPPSAERARPTSFGFKAGLIPSFTPAFLKKHRRSSSPLKHEYEPSSASSLSESEVSGIEHDDDYTSVSSAEHAFEDLGSTLGELRKLPDDQVSTIGELKSFPLYGGYKQMRQPTPPESLYAPSDPSLSPSQSASQAPYRTVPRTQARAAQVLAGIFAWMDSGSWDSLHPEDCCIVVTPGLIEAFDIAQAQAAPAANEEEAMQSPSTRGVKPLVALELTPLVPLRRGTALDISIRSPPTANSLYRTGSNIMFRSRSAEECETLYHLLNRARIDNPTYLALQRARGPMPQSNWGEVMEQRNNAQSVGRSWFGYGSRKGSTYRSKSVSRPRSVAATESSVGTMQTAFSALRRFSSGSKFFNIAKSTITSRQGSRTTYSDSLDSGVATPAQLDPSMGTPVGPSNMKIRLYMRETTTKWRDMGPARLTVLIPPRPDPAAPANPLLTGREKRIVISGKSRGQILLDSTLGESAFERVARTGIAMSVWQENIDGMVATTGGVLAAKTTVYMLQMKSDREAAYCFGLVGKLRY